MPALREHCSWLEGRYWVSSFRAETIADRCVLGPSLAPQPWRMMGGLQTMDASEEVGSHGAS
jgi:hypothetical protein